MQTPIASEASVPTVEMLLGELPQRPTGEGEALIRRAYSFAQRAHAGQRRKSGDPYFIHPAHVGRMLAEMVSDPETIASGLLHDVLEDTNVTETELTEAFGQTVTDLVDGVTKISNLSACTPREQQIDDIRKMILAMSRDVRVIIIKLCDRLHNMQTLEYLPPARQRAIAQSTRDIFAPLAARLGMMRIRSLLEDLAMRYLQPTAYFKVAKKMAVRELRDRQFVDHAHELLNEKLMESNIPALVQSRRKHVSGVYSKMQRQGLRFDEVHDLNALRVVCDTVRECYDILGIVHSLWKPIPGKFKDYIGVPKENGYRSIHTSVFAAEGEVLEVQIRTHQMHRLAEEGVASHWIYKEDGGSNGASGKGEDTQRLTWLRGLVEWLKDVHDPEEFMAELRRDVFDTAVFCYTPKGDIIEMPRGATAIDVAYRIHTELGHHCVGVRINQRMGSIREKLKTGDIVEILTSKTAHPTADWLQIAQTGRARNKIRQWLKARQREYFLEAGRRMLTEAVKTRFGSQIEMEQVQLVLANSFHTFSVGSWDELMVELGAGTVKVASLIGRLEQVLRPPAQRRPPRNVRRSRRATRDVVLVDGMDGAITRLAKCCSPLPGDPIIGFITQGKGISVHRRDCKAMERIRERSADASRRLVTVEWGDASHRLQRTGVRLVCQDRRGLLGDITTVFGQLGINITGVNSNSNIRDNRAIIKIQMLIEDSDQLNQLLSRLERIPGVQSLSRSTQSPRRRASGRGSGG